MAEQVRRVVAANDGRPVTLGEIIGATLLPKAKALDVLQALAAEGKLVEMDGDEGQVEYAEV